MPVLTIDHEEYPSVIVIEYNSLYKNELINFIKNIKIKDNKEVYTTSLLSFILIFFIKLINSFLYKLLYSITITEGYSSWSIVKTGI